MEELSSWLQRQSTRHRRVAILSPHADDAALAIDGSIQHLSRVAECHLLTVFIRSTHAPGYPELRDPEQITALRGEEDQRFAEATGLELITLGFVDSSILGYTTRAEIRGDYRDQRFPEVCQSIAAGLDQLSPDLVLAPLALWGHVDHRIVFEAVRRCEIPPLRRIYYEDLPYAWYLSEVALQEEI